LTSGISFGSIFVTETKGLRPSVSDSNSPSSIDDSAFLKEEKNNCKNIN